jgi:hypothetical protein
MKNNLMIDLETMSTESNAAIIAIGAVFFDADGLGESYYEKINLQSCIDLGLRIDASTIIWWLQQSEDARKEFFDNGKSCKLNSVLNIFKNFVLFSGKKIDNNGRVKDLIVWGNGSAFDIVILRNAYNVCRRTPFWSYKNERCFRTYKATNPEIKNIPDDRPAHNALEDAIWQAEYAVEILNKRFK